MKIYVAHATQFDYMKWLYPACLKWQCLFPQHNLVLPHLKQREPDNSQRLIAHVDHVIAEVSVVSTGVGIELGFAHHFKIPISCVYQRGKRYSSSLGLIAQSFHSYCSENELIEIFDTIIGQKG